MKGGYQIIGDLVYRVRGTLVLLPPMLKNDKLEIKEYTSFDFQNVGPFPVIIEKKWTIFPGGSKNIGLEDLHDFDGCENLHIEFLSEINGTALSPVAGFYPTNRLEISGIKTRLEKYCKCNEFNGY